MKVTYNFTTRNKLFSFIMFLSRFVFKTHFDFQMKYNYICMSSLCSIQMLSLGCPIRIKMIIKASVVFGYPL